MLTLASANLWDLYDPDRPAPERWRQVEDMLAELDPDVLVVQELIARGPDKRSGAADAAAVLAGALGMESAVDGVPAVAVGGGIHHVAILWRRTLSPVPGSVARYERDPAGLWHALVTVEFDLGGSRLRVGSVHLSPFDGISRAQDVRQVHRAICRDGTSALVGGDWNCLGGDETYDRDPYAAALADGWTWDPDWAYQYAADGSLDRAAAQWFEGPGGMRDCARLAGVAWEPTTGHVAEPHPPRRIDRWYATPSMPEAAIVDVQVAAAEHVGTASDHRPVIVTVNPYHLATREQQ